MGVAEPAVVATVGSVEAVQPQSWHHGLVARWWAMFRTSGPEVEFVRRFVEDGQPALDVACGNGRLLVPYVRDGLDVDGVDASQDMLDACAEAAAAVGASPGLFCQSLHELDLPRRYRTAYAIGALGLGSTREQDQEALRRLHHHLEPGGRLVLDNEVPYSGATTWARWPRGARDDLPEPEREPTERRLGPDGDEYAYVARLLGVDPLDQREAWEMHAFQWHEGELVAEERRRLTANLYFAGELVLMLEKAGFVDIEVRGGHRDEPPTPEDDTLVYLAARR